MPVLSATNYRPPMVFRNPHINSIYPIFFRSLAGVEYDRERIITPDEDFIDLDWSSVGSEHLVLILHGLEGHSEGAHAKGMVRFFNQNGWDGVGFNFRGCSGEPNWKLRSYHMGEIGDLTFVLEYIKTHYNYKSIVAVGFSLGGSVLLNYLARSSKQFLDAAVAFSVPVEIKTTNDEIKKWKNFPYFAQFMVSMNNKLIRQASYFPNQINIEVPRPKSFKEIDDRYTAPIHGFKDAEDYWAKCSSLPVLPQIKTPTLLISAQDDTFLSPQCYPKEVAEKNPNFYVKYPKYGGHCGFVSFNAKNGYWSEMQALQFVTEKISTLQTTPGRYKSS